MKITKEVKTGFIVIITLVAFYATYNYMKGKNLFAAGNTYFVIYDNVNGLSTSKPVTVNGLRVGRVDDIKIVDDVTPIYFIATIKLDRKINFSKNTVAQIHEPGMMSGAEVRLLLDYEGSLAIDGDTLKGDLKPSLLSAMGDDLELDQTKSKLDSLLVVVRGAASGVDKLLNDENQQNFKEILKSLNNTLISFGETSKSLTKTSNNANAMIEANNEQLKSTLAATENTMNKFGEVADKMSNLELEKIIRNFEESSNRLNATLEKINNGEGTMGALINDKELYDNLNKTSKNLEELIADLKENPNKYVQFSIFGKKQ